MLEALGIGEHPVDSLETVHPVLEAMKLALADLNEHVADNEHMRLSSEHLLDVSYLMDRAGLVGEQAANPGHGSPKPGGTVYLSTADESGMMVSFIQSNYMGFGSGVVVPGTGISLQNRGARFSLDPQHVNVVAPRKRPFHTIIPGFVMNADGTPLMSFGLMGGPRRIESGLKVAVERSFDPQVVEALRAKGHDVVVEAPRGVFAFGGTQIIQRTAHGYVGGTDPRKDGLVAAF